jgi:hypothetical protein
VAGFFMRGRLGGMADDQLKRLRELSENINASIAQATVELFATKDQGTKDLLAKSLTELQRLYLRRSCPRHYDLNRKISAV